MLEKIQPYAKFVAALIGTAITAGSSLILPEGLEWLTFAGALLTTIAVYGVPNIPADDDGLTETEREADRNAAEARAEIAGR